MCALNIENFIICFKINLFVINLHSVSPFQVVAIVVICPICILWWIFLEKCYKKLRYESF